MPLNWVFAIGLAFAISSTSLLLSVNPEPVHASVCLGPFSPSEAFAEATSVFVGKPIQVTEVSWLNTLETTERGIPRTGFKTYEFEVETVWKGVRYETMFVNTSISGGSWGFGFQLGEEYIVYAYDSDYEDGLWAYLCTGSKVTSVAQDDFEQLGKGSAPEPGTEAPRPNLNIPSSSGGGCNILAQSTDGPTDAWTLTLVAGIMWFGFRRRRRG